MPLAFYHFLFTFSSLPFSSSSSTLYYCYLFHFFFLFFFPSIIDLYFPLFFSFALLSKSPIFFFVHLIIHVLGSYLFYFLNFPSLGFLTPAFHLFFPSFLPFTFPSLVHLVFHLGNSLFYRLYFPFFISLMYVYLNFTPPFSSSLSYFSEFFFFY